MIQAVSGNDAVPHVVVGVGSEVPARTNPERFRQKYGITSPFVVYVGRIDENKGCTELFSHFERYTRAAAGRPVAGADGDLDPAHPRQPAHPASRLRVRRGQVRRHRRRRSAHHAVLLREPVDGGPRGVGARQAGAGERPLRRAAGPVPAQQRRALLRERRGVPRDAGAHPVEPPAGVAPWARTAASTSSATTRGRSSCASTWTCSTGCAARTRAARRGRRSSRCRGGSRGGGPSCRAGNDVVRGLPAGPGAGAPGGADDGAARPAVHQVLATLGYGDAIGHEVLGIQRVLRGAGYESDIFVETADPRLEDLTRDFRELVEASPPRQHPDPPLLHRVEGLARRVRAAGPDGARLPQHHAARVLRRRAPRCSCASATTAGANWPRTSAGATSRSATRSSTARNSRRSGFPRHRRASRSSRTSRTSTGRPTTWWPRQFDDEWTNVLFVGRVIPNKRIENVIRAFAAYKSRYNHAVAPAHRRGPTAVSSATSRCCSSWSARLGAPGRALHGPRVERGTDGVLRRRRRVPLRQRARGVLRAAGRGLLQAHPRAGATRARRCRRRWTAPACCTTSRTRPTSPRSIDAVVGDAALQERILDRPGRGPRAPAAPRLRRHAARASSTRSSPRRAGRDHRVAWDFWQQFDTIERLEAQRLFRPSLYKALPTAARPAASTGSAEP